jgi:hypothetical protein
LECEEKELIQQLLGKSWVSTTSRKAGWGVAAKAKGYTESQKEEPAEVQTPSTEYTLKNQR